MRVIYKIKISSSAQKDFRMLKDKIAKNRIIKRINSLVENPRPPAAIKLTGSEAYRIRQGNYRINYTIQDEILLVEIIKIGHRRDVYT